MHRLLLGILLIAGFCGLAVLPYSHVWSTETLFPSSTLSPVSTTSGFSTSAPFSISTPSPSSVSTDYELAQHHGTSQDLMPLQIVDRDVDKLSQHDPSDKIISEQPFEIDDQPYDSNGNISGSAVLVDLMEKRAVEKRATRPKGKGVFMGVAQINCLETILVCKNAGWYQNCLMGARVDHTKVLYINGRRDPVDDHSFSDDNRYNSGVSTSWATPCNAPPFPQLSYDRWQGPKLTTLKKDKKTGLMEIHWVGLQADEWPMASMYTESFDPNAQVPQVSLRCMNGADNTGGSQSIMNFRRCKGDYKAGGSLEAHRFGAVQGVKQCQHLDEGDTYHVYLNFTMFDPKNATHNDLRK
jgi:hypothetical protein